MDKIMSVIVKPNHLSLICHEIIHLALNGGNFVHLDPRDHQVLRIFDKIRFVTTILLTAEYTTLILCISVMTLS